MDLKITIFLTLILVRRIAGNPLLWAQFIPGTNGSIKSSQSNAQWIFREPVQIGTMLHLNFTKGSISNQLQYIIDKTSKMGFKALFGENQNCFYFANPNETSTDCPTKARNAGCSYTNLKTAYLRIIDKKDENFSPAILRYEMVRCSVPTTSPPEAKFVPPHLPTLTTTEGTTATDTRPTMSGTMTTTTTTSATAASTAASNSTSVLLETKANSSNTENSTNLSKITATTPVKTTDTKYENQGGGANSTIIIVVIIVAVFFVLVLILLLFFGRRFSRYRKEMKVIRCEKSQAALPLPTGRHPKTPTSVHLYEEIVPQLPTRNTNMREPGYEIPLCVMSGSQNQGNGEKDQLSIENELYHKPLMKTDQIISSAPNGNSKYGMVENELYRKKQEAEYKINANIRDSDSKSIEEHRELNPEPDTTNDELIIPNNQNESTKRSNRVDNVLYNL